MKRIFIPLVVIAVIGMSFSIHFKKTKIVFFGDSITQFGAGPTGYITKLDSMIKQKGLGDNYELVGAGVSGNKVYDLYLRMETDVLEKNPDVVIIYVGINDVWHKASSGTGTDADKYEKFYRAIIKKLTDKNIKVIVCTPSVIGERNDYTNQQDGDLNRYSVIIRNMAKELSLTVCDLRKDFINYLQANNPKNAEKGILTADRVHLNDAGNLFVANEMWQAIQAANK